MKHRSLLVPLTIVASLILSCCGQPAATTAPEPRLAAPTQVAQVSQIAQVSNTSKTARPARDFRAEATQYIGWYNTIRLTPEQEAIKNAALSKIPAPCCSENSIATCCCPCNMAKAVWGLSAHLIVNQGYDAPRLEKAVRDWLAAANPHGYSGKACTTGGCARSFEHDGCGGMVEAIIL